MWLTPPWSKRFYLETVFLMDTLIHKFLMEPLNISELLKDLNISLWQQRDSNPQRSSLTFRQLECRFTLKRVRDMIITYVFVSFLIRKSFSFLYNFFIIIIFASSFRFYYYISRLGLISILALFYSQALREYFMPGNYFFSFSICASIRRGREYIQKRKNSILTL